MRFSVLIFFGILFSVTSCNLPIETDKLEPYVMERLEGEILTSYFQTIQGVGDFTRVKTTKGKNFVFIKIKKSELSNSVDVLNSNPLDHSPTELLYNINLGVEVKRVIGGNSNYKGIWSDGICQTNSKDSLKEFQPEERRKLFLTDQSNNPVQIQFKDDGFKLNKIKTISIERLAKSYLIKIDVDSPKDDKVEKILKKEGERILNEINH